MAIDLHTYAAIKVSGLQGRYVTQKHIEPFLATRGSNFHCTTLGQSVEGRAIKSITVGTGQKKVLMWSQMHGNEATTTKAVADLLQFLQSERPLASQLLTQCTLKIIPILNPDGAAAYTRFNANAVDLNRDAQNRSQPESRILRATYDAFQPDFCFNLHDQRTMYNVGASAKPATVSFLAPSHDEDRTISPSRLASMKLIAAMNAVLQKEIPGQVGRYDDAFNANCVGDTFQMLQTPTVLFEAGHYYDDYEREKTREFIFIALLTALDCLANGNENTYTKADYFAIPENDKRFFDVLVRNAQLIDPSLGPNIGLRFTELLRHNEIRFEPKIEKAGQLEGYFGHRSFDCANDKELSELKRQEFWKLLKI